MDSLNDSAREKSGQDAGMTSEPATPLSNPPAAAPQESAAPSGEDGPAPHKQMPAASRGGPSQSATPGPLPSGPQLSRGPSPAELAADLGQIDDRTLDQAVEEAMGGLTEADLTAGGPPTPQFDQLSPGDLVAGRVANVGSDDVLIDFDGKSLGAMPLAEMGKDETYAVGQRVEVMVIGRDGRSGLLSVSRRKAKRAAIVGNMKVGMVLEGRVVGMNKGGLEVEIEGMRGFIPASQVDVRFVKDISALIGQTIRAEVTKFELDEDVENIVLSRRKVLEREETERKENLLQTLQPGEVLQGVVRSLAEYGAFVDIGGVDGLLHVTDMSWGRVNKPEDVVKVGDRVNVMVTKVNREKKRISLSLKQTTPNPWDTVEQKYSTGTRIQGRVVRLESFGAFVELEPGLDGLLPISELSWTRRVRHPSEVVKEGDVVEVSILNIDVEKKRLSLSLKALGEDPWATIAQRYAEGSRVKGKVVRTTDFGAFVSLEDGIDGLIHISELSDERVRAVTDKVQVGQEVEVRVLSVDAEAKKIGLSLKEPPTRPSPEEIARFQAERAAQETAAAKKQRARPRRGGITVGWDDGGMTLGSLDPSKFASS